MEVLRGHWSWNLIDQSIAIILSIFVWRVEGKIVIVRGLLSIEIGLCLLPLELNLVLLIIILSTHVYHFSIIICFVGWLLEAHLCWRHLWPWVLMTTVERVHHGCRYLSGLLGRHSILVHSRSLLIVEWQVLIIITNSHLSHHFLI